MPTDPLDAIRERLDARNAAQEPLAKWGEMLGEVSSLEDYRIQEFIRGLQSQKDFEDAAPADIATLLALVEELGSRLNQI